MKSFIKEFLTNLLCGLIICTAVLILIGIAVLIFTCISDGILQAVLFLLYAIILAALLKTFLDRADRELINKIRGYK